MSRSRLFSVAFAGIVIVLFLLGMLSAVDPAKFFGLFRANSQQLPPTPDLSWYGAVALRTRITGTLTVLLCLVAMAFRGRIWHYVAALGAGFSSANRYVQGRLRNFWLHENRWHIAGLLILCGIGLVLRVISASQPVENDEAKSYVFYAAKPWLVALADYSAPNNHILMNVIDHFVTRLLGDSLWIVRLPTLIAGTLTIPATYIGARQLFNKHAALLAAAVMTVSSVMIGFSSIARGYSLIALASVILVILVPHLVRGRNPAVWFTFVVVAALGFLAIPTMLYPFTGIWLWLLILTGWSSQPARRQALIDLFKASVATVLLVVALYTPLLIFSGINTLLNNGYVAPISFAEVFQQLPGFLEDFVASLHEPLPVFLAGLLIVGALISVVFNRRLSRFPVPMFVVLLTTNFLLLFATRRVPPDRIWSFMIPFYAMTAASGLVFALQSLFRSSQSRWAPQLAIGAVVIVTLAIAVPERVTLTSFPEAEQIAHYLTTELKPGDQVFSRFPTRASTMFYLYRTSGEAYFGYFAPQGGENFNVGPRWLVLIEQSTSPLEQNIVVKFDDGSPIVPRLLYSFGDARVYEIRRTGAGVEPF